MTGPFPGRRHRLSVIGKFALALIGLLGLARPTTAASDAPPINVELQGTPQALADARNPVSIVQLDRNRYITANYRQLSLIDLHQLRIATLAPEWHIPPTRFVPTGLAYDRRRHALYIANYTANDILRAEVDEGHDRLLITEAFGAGSVKSPEGISYDPERELLATAQYDGNSVAIFHHVAGQWQLTCSVATPEAHGVAIAGPYVFATSLADRALLKINTDACTIAQRVGHLGWDSLRGEFMWPTTVQQLSDGSIGVSDAQTGRLSIVDPTTMTIRTAFGSNRPGFGGLNMPYAFAETTDGNLMVLSTYGNRLIEFSKNGGVIASYSLGQKWPADGASYNTSLGPPAWREYVDTGQHASLLGGCFFGGYAQLVSCNGAKNLTLPRPEDRFLSGGCYFYFNQIAPTRYGAVVVSPQNPIALSIGTIGDRVFMIPSWIGLDSWIDGGKIVRAGGDLAIAALAAETEARALDSTRQSETNGKPQVPILAFDLDIASPPDNSASDCLIADTIKKASVTARGYRAVDEILAHFADPVGKRFIADSARCTQQHCSRDRWCDISRDMAAEISRAPVIDLVRWVIASDLNGCILHTLDNNSDDSSGQPAQKP